VELQGFREGGLRLPLGSDCVKRYETKVEGMKGDLEAVRGFVKELEIQEIQEWVVENGNEERERRERKDFK
jgi:hypothetical protein